LSPEGERQLAVDIVYIRKLIGQFISGHTKDLFEAFDSILIGVLAPKKDAENKSVDEILENALIRE
jgi:hypothetical protein